MVTHTECLLPLWGTVKRCRLIGATTADHTGMASFSLQRLWSQNCPCTCGTIKETFWRGPFDRKPSILTDQGEIHQAEVNGRDDE